jgi:glutamate/tyrosine decarboxylase-like PLP-dependent enzyme
MLEADKFAILNREHGYDEYQRVLSAFINPQNVKMSFENFVHQLIGIGVGDGSGRMTAADHAIKKALFSLGKELKDSRPFDSTYIGHMCSETSIPGMIAYMFALRTGSNTVSREASVKESLLEPEAINGLMEIVGYKVGFASGTFTSGGTMANLTALTVARKLMQERLSNFNRRKMRVLVSPMAHYSIPKCIDLLGGPGKEIEIISVKTKNFRMSIEDLEKKVLLSKKDGVPIMAIIGIAGNTETGIVDPLKEIAEVAEKQGGIFTHADAAYGGPYRLSKIGHLFEGIERFNSITLDPHKAFYTPYSTGAVLFKNAEEHTRLAIGVKADYVQFNSDLSSLIEDFRTGKGNHGLKRIEGSMGAGPILSTLAILRILGKEGLRVVYDFTLDRIHHLFERIKASPYLEPLHRPELNLLCFTLKPKIMRKLNLNDNEKLGLFINNCRVLLDKKTNGKGGYFFSATNLPVDESNTIWTWRSCIMNPRSTDKVIDEAIESLEKLIKKAMK